MKKFVLLATIFLALSVWGSAYGNIVDEQEIVEQAACDKAGYTGEKWGLCNIYCEILNCDSKIVYPADDACDKIKEIFNTKYGGNEPPCYYSYNP